MPAQAIVNPRLYQRVVTRLRRQIQSGQLPVGGRLPSEKLLAQQLGVSRPTVREAMIALEIAGLVEVRTGSGAYVLARQASTVADVDAGPGPIELLKARMLIEGEIAAEAALYASSADLEEIEKTILEMERLRENGTHSRSADRSFHVQVARASGNDVLAAIVGSLWEGMASPLFSRLSERTHLVRREEQAIAEHRTILAALSTGDALGARTAMRQHLKKVESILADADLSNG